MQPAAVIFDLDETLFDHRGAALAGVRAWLAELGEAASDELTGLWFSLEERYVRAWHRGELSFAEQRRERIREMLATVGRDGADDAALDASFARYLLRYEAGWRRFDDVDDALADVAAAGLRVAVLTNGAERQQNQKLSAVDLAGRVGPVFCCDALGFAKPDARAYELVCERLDMSPARVLHVGDRHDLDVVAARDAGLSAVHLDRDDRGPLGERARISSLRELGPFLASRDG
ncbi:MAG: HAD family hydrolase [Solirubrobacteraceae bacterium]